jgi:hypothetical protein
VLAIDAGAPPMWIDLGTYQLSEGEGHLFTSSADIFFAIDAQVPSLLTVTADPAIVDMTLFSGTCDARVPIASGTSLSQAPIPTGRSYLRLHQESGTFESLAPFLARFSLTPGGPN